MTYIRTNQNNNELINILQVWLMIRNSGLAVTHIDTRARGIPDKPRLKPYINTSNLQVPVQGVHDRPLNM